jgi:hypothetical protein
MQDRKTYAKGSTLESTTGYVVKVGMPVVDDTVKATSNGATFTENAPLTDGQYLVTIEVNGEAVAYKESVTADSGITVGDYSVAENAGKIVLTGASANDIVRLLIEPLEVSVSDGFRAAINKAAPKSGGGGSADNRFIVTLTPTAQDFSGTMDKTVAEIDAAYKAGQQLVFRVMTSETTYMEADCTGRKHNGITYPSFNGFILSTDVTDNSGKLIYAWTGATNDGTMATYSTAIFTLTPAT